MKLWMFRLTLAEFQETLRTLDLKNKLWFTKEFLIFPGDQDVHGAEAIGIQFEGGVQHLKQQVSPDAFEQTFAPSGCSLFSLNLWTLAFW